MRQTDLTLDQIRQLLNSNTERYPYCLLVNEAGAIFHEQKDEASEKFLLELLNSEKPAFRIISFCFLYTGKDMREKHHALFTEFRNRPENQEYLENIDGMIERFEHQYWQ